MRVYLPATVTMLRELRETGLLTSPRTAFAVGPTLREAYADADADELEYAAFTDAARASLRLLDADPGAPRRRVVVSADVPDSAVSDLSHLDRAAVKVEAPVMLADVAAVHVDDPAAEADVRAAAAATLSAELGDADAQFTVDSAEGHELAWYAVQELGPLLELWGTT
jgi:hypothetical protein